ncbi:MAG: HAD hydrolase-like protein [Azoarcus sp.]|jgi:phosphoglycolate phosphatase|nr:HAD hydrolase-like protein [Azoarcus sp.]
MRPTHILFDLDGTLIDSAQAILASYRTAFAACGVTPVRAIVPEIVGPPIDATLRMLVGGDDPVLVARLADAFKQSYDTGGLLETRAYPGIADMLHALRAADLTLSIATNKRIHPTLLILAHLGWRDLFATVYALDLFSPRLPDKAAMIGRLLADQGIEAARACYVGDRIEDGEAAGANALPFVAATWGYGNPRAPQMGARWRTVDTPAALGRLLLEATCFNPRP